MPEQSAAALNPIIKVVNLVAILIAPLVAVPWSGGCGRRLWSQRSRPSPQRSP